MRNAAVSWPPRCNNKSSKLGWMMSTRRRYVRSLCFGVATIVSAPEIPPGLCTISRSKRARLFLCFLHFHVHDVQPRSVVFDTACWHGFAIACVMICTYVRRRL